jgi:hypothetical protein
MNCVDKEIEFRDFELIHKGFRVVWEWIGEGVDGDYNEEDEDDTPLLRFSCFKRYVRKDYADPTYHDDWEELADSSYCTRMPVNSSLKHLAIAASIILEALEDNADNGCYKKRLEELSWFCPDDFNVKSV